MSKLTAAPSTNEAVWHASAAALYDGDIDAFLSYWEPDGSYEVAYPVAGMPARVSGRDALAELFAGFRALAASIRIEDVRFHATADHNLAFVEERMLAELHGGGSYENELCLRVGFRNGRIASIYEYYGERAHQDLLERLRGASQSS